MYLSTVLLFFLVSKFVYCMDPTRRATEWIEFDDELTEEVKQFLLKARETFKLFLLDKASINVSRFVLLLKQKLHPDDICRTKTDEFSQVYVMPEGHRACYDHCKNQNYRYQELMNENISRLTTDFFTNYHTALRKTIKLKAYNDDTMSECKQAGKNFECTCSPKHIVKVNTQFKDFVANTLFKYTTENNNQPLEIQEHFVALVFVLKYYPKTAIFYIRWLANQKSFTHLSSTSSTTDDGYIPLNSSSLEDGLQIENLNLNDDDDDDHSFITKDTELFDILFNLIYSRCDIARFFNWCDAIIDVFCTLFTGTVSFCIFASLLHLF